MNKNLVIRPVVESDVETLRTLIAALAENENEQEYLTVSAEVLRKTGFGENPLWSGLMALFDSEAAGYATYTNDFHIWSGSPRMTLDDIFVRPEFRSLGIGEKLMNAVFDEARKTGAYVSWTVRTDNKKAIAFYERLGAHYRVIGKCGWRPVSS